MSQCETPGALGHLSAVVTGETASALFGMATASVTPLQGVTLGESNGMRKRMAVCFVSPFLREGKPCVTMAGDGGQLSWGYAHMLMLGGSPLTTG